MLNYLSQIVCPVHHKPVKSMNIAEGFEHQRVLCQDCSNHEGQEIHEVLSKWEETQSDQVQNIKQSTIEVKSKLTEILNQFETFRKNIVETMNILINQVKQSLSTIQRISDHRIKEINEYNKYLTFSKLHEIAEQMSKPKEQQQYNQEYQEIIENLEQQVQDQVFFSEKVSYQTQLLQYNKQNIVQQYESTIGLLIQPTSITYEIIRETYHREQCRAIAFGSNTMITGFGDYIKVWSFDEGYAEENSKLMGHSNTVNCLVYSQNTDMFVSGSSDQTVKVWRKQNHEWIYIDLGKVHNDFVVGLLLNQKDDQIISCSHDSTMKVWNYEGETWVYYQCLTNHRDAVNCINFNQSQTQFVSCSQDNQIILWEISKKYWNLRQILKNDNFGFRVAFLDDHQIAWQPKFTGITKIYELDNIDGLFKEQESLKIQLKQEYQDNWLFPTIFNNNTQILVQKHNKYIYLIAKIDYRWKVMQIIEMSHHNNYGNLSKDGQYLTLWDSYSRALKIYKISYI